MRLDSPGTQRSPGKRAILSHISFRFLDFPDGLKVATLTRTLRAGSS
ncbi:hypothetical protein RISK_000545 [Rhodopirellula islandica]|uniref:Uncharacterized protein n=1 Tax=Rhodopirellula islandica TaxID=595434 RepID=A0A0J1BLX0_RHOIS|nr:hypothetical protein RISK_000545 [Rhodopirellula islandica]